LLNIQPDKHWRLVMGYARSASCQSDNYTSHMFIRQVSLDQFSRRSAWLATVSHDWYYSKHYPLFT
jgi:hypothetical protein